MHQNRHSCIPRTNFSYANYHSSFIKSKPTDIPIQKIISSTATPAFFPNQSYQSTKAYQHRAVSLPPQKIIASALPINQPIRIEERGSESQRVRRNKIFQQRWSPLREKNRYSPPKVSQQQTKAGHFQQKSDIAVQCGATILQNNEATNQLNGVVSSRAILAFLERNSQEKRKVEEEKKQLLEEINKKQEERARQELKKKEIQRQKISQRVYHKVIEKIIENGSSNKKYQTPNQQELSKKDQEIAFLKMQVERLQRCDRLNKENQTLYRRLVNTLRENSAHSSFIETSSKKRKEQLELSPSKITPVNDLSEINRESAGDISQIDRQSIVINKKDLNVVSKQSSNRSPPKQFIRSPAKPVSPSKGAEFAQIIKQPEEMDASKTVTFHKVNPRVSTHSKRIRQEQWFGAVKVYRNTKENNDHRIAIGQAPITRRLGEMNHHLQRSMNARPRSSSKPHWNLLKDGYEDVLGRSFALKARISMY